MTLDQTERDEAIQPTDHLTELQGTVLAGLISCWNDSTVLLERVGEAIAKVQDEHMGGPLFPLWRIIIHYYPQTGALPSPKAFDEMLQGSTKLPLPDKIRLSKSYVEFSQQDVLLSQFRLAMLRLAERWRDQQYGQLLSTAQRIHLNGTSVNGQQLSGFEESIEYLQSQLARLSRLTHQEDTQEGDINLEVAEFLRQYVAAKQGKLGGILTGFTDLDVVTRGLYPGELWLAAGFTSEGKSKLVYNIAYHACYKQGKHVLFGTNEATRDQVRRNLIVRHSHEPRFNLPHPLRYSDLKFGSLRENDEEGLRNVLRDMRSGPGHMFVFQMPDKATLDYVSDVLRRQRRMYKPDLIVLDYLGLIAGSRRVSHREELDDVVSQAKRIAVELNVPVLSPWQMSREAWKEAQKTGRYTKASLAETSAAERSSDVIISILRKDDQPNQLSGQILKNRDGEAGTDFILTTDFATSYVGNPLVTGDLLSI